MPDESRIHFDGLLKYEGAARKLLTQTIERVDPIPSSSLPDWILTGHRVEQYLSYYIAHSIREDWTGIATSVGELVHKIEDRFTSSETDEDDGPLTKGNGG